MANCKPFAALYRPTGALLIALLAYALYDVWEIFEVSDFRLVSRRAKPPTPAGLTVTTLAYNVPWDMDKVSHNCRMISGTRHRFLIFTDRMNAPFCRLCRCRRFIPSRCPPPNAKPKARNNCEKSVFTARMVPRLGEMVYLDSDLIIMRRDFLDRLYWRSRGHDFLASYDPSGYGKEVKYYNFINSGLFFMRSVKSANYSDLVPRMYKARTGFDQSVLTRFVHQYYKHWDTLSWRWHCRNMLRMKQDTPLRECYTIHDRNEWPKLLKMMNYTLLTIPTNAQTDVDRRKLQK